MCFEECTCAALYACWLCTTCGLNDGRCSIEPACDSTIHLDTCSKVAEVIRGVVTHEKKAFLHLRNITSKQSKRLVAHKLADLTGDKTLAGVQDFVEKVPIQRLTQSVKHVHVISLEEAKRLLLYTHACLLNPSGTPRTGLACESRFQECLASAAGSRGGIGSAVGSEQRRYLRCLCWMKVYSDQVVVSRMARLTGADVAGCCGVRYDLCDYTMLWSAYGPQLWSLVSLILEYRCKAFHMASYTGSCKALLQILLQFRALQAAANHHNSTATLAAAAPGCALCHLVQLVHCLHVDKLSAHKQLKINHEPTA